jgi:dolichol-phosphate mannosyltransferase
MNDMENQSSIPTETNRNSRFTLSLVVPCYNEEATLAECIRRVLQIANDTLQLEIIIVDDGSTDTTGAIAGELAKKHPEIKILRHKKNRGKGASLRSGFKMVTGDVVAVQDADLEYDPMDLKKLAGPIVGNEADVVLGSRFLSTEFRRVLYFWHYLGNRFLTFLSNMFTDLNISDMETCYKVFRREILQQIEIRENRFGVEPEIIAKMANLRLRILEAGISYRGRTYEEGKKIIAKDGLRALYCILKYNAYCAPVPVQLFLYFIIGGIAAVCNLLTFHFMSDAGNPLAVSALTAFFVAAAVNYFLCVLILFRHKARWNTGVELLLYIGMAGIIGFLDLTTTSFLIHHAVLPIPSKIFASLSVFLLNFTGRRFLIFPAKPRRPWMPRHY